MSIKSISAILTACAMFAYCAARADINYAALFKAETYQNVDTTYRSADGYSIARIRLKSMGFAGDEKKWGIPIPQTLRIKTLALDVYCRNLTDAELAKLKVPPLFSVEAENFSMSLYGKKNKMTVSANRAILKKNLTIQLDGNVKIATEKGEVNLGNSVTISLDGRLLTFVYGGGEKKFAIKF